MGDTNLDGRTIEVDRRATDAIQTTQLLEIDFGQRLLRIDLVGGSASGLDHTTGRAEDHAGSGGFA